jgi:hypothetical protein
MTRPNRDVFGHCIICGKNMLTDRVVEGETVQMFTPDKDNAQYLLDDGSKMNVSMCRPCKDELDGTEIEDVMKKVIRGWQHELETYSKWPQERKDNYMEVYGKKKIVVRSDDKPDDVLEKIKKSKKDK